MYYPSPYSYSSYSLEQRFQHFVHQQQEWNRLMQSKIEEMEDTLGQLKQQVEQIKPVTIENINYKIQELAVKELKGTLNIGMTALTDPEEIQKWLATPQSDKGVNLQDIEQPNENENENEDQ
ncbi:spore germination protein GerPC [Paenibacillus turpanensis]|uniref:spore germination protein GerPC n=1 Tax=Paenibacillus turpanensis TaxID=2689078 RepID=UPI00140D7BD1|nr:spore germination protein GerPC [Paenibacillus turpanensis]